MKGKFFVLINIGAGTCRVCHFGQRLVRDFHENVELERGVSKAEAEKYCREFFGRGEKIEQRRK